MTDSIGLGKCWSADVRSENLVTHSGVTIGFISQIAWMTFDVD